MPANGAKRLKWIEAQMQEAALQQLMLEALACQPPEFGLLVVPSDVDLFVTTINRARARDPLLQAIQIRIVEAGVVVCFDPTKEAQL